MALFLKPDASLNINSNINLEKFYSKPIFLAMTLNKNFSPPSSFGKSKFVKMFKSIDLTALINSSSKNGNRHSFPLDEIARSSRPKFLIHNRFRSKK